MSTAPRTARPCLGLTRSLLAAGAGVVATTGLVGPGCSQTVERSYLLVTVQGTEGGVPGTEAPRYQLGIQLGTRQHEVQPSEAQLSAETPPRFAVRLPDDAAGQAATVRITAYVGDCPVQTASSVTQLVTAGLNELVVRLPARSATPCGLSVTVHGSGQVVSEPPGISCPGTCSARFSPRQRVKLTATPSGGAGGLIRWDQPVSCGPSTTCDLGELPPTGATAEVTMAAGPPAIDRCATTSLVRASSPPVGTLNGVWVGSSGEAWAVGDGGVVLHRSFGLWSLEPLPGGPSTTDTLTGVLGTGAPTSLFISGSGNTVWVRRSSNTIGSYRKSGGTSQLLAISGSSSAEVWAVGEAGETLRVDDAKVSASSAPLGDGVTGPRSGVWTDAPDNVWFASAAGQLTHRTTSGLTMRGVSPGVRGLFGTPLGALWLVGPGTNVWRIPADLSAADGYGAPQDQRTAPGLPAGTLALNGVWSDGGNVWAVGDGGALYCKPSGSDTWRALAGQTSNLRAVHGYIGPTESRLIVVGAQGLVLESPL